MKDMQKDDSSEMDIRACSTALIKDSGGDRYLLEYSHDRNAWQIPGGRLRHNESPYEALIRELREEIGFDADKIGIIKLVTFDFRRNEAATDSMMHFFFLLDYNGSLKDDITPDGIEVNSVGLFTAEEVLTVLKDGYAARRVKLALSSNNQCMYLENAKKVL